MAQHGVWSKSPWYLLITPRKPNRCFEKRDFVKIRFSLVNNWCLFLPRKNLTFFLFFSMTSSGFRPWSRTSKMVSEDEKQLGDNRYTDFEEVRRHRIRGQAGTAVN